MNTVHVVVALLAALTILAAPVPADTQNHSLAAVERLTLPVRDPIGIAVREDGTMLVSDRAAGAIVEMLPDDRTRRLVTGLWKPWGIAIDADGSLLIAEEYGRLLRVENDGTITTLATRLYRPRWIAGDGRSVYTSAAGARYPHTVLAGEEPPLGQVILRRTPDGPLVRVADSFFEAPALVVNGEALYAVGQGVGMAGTPGPMLALRLPLGPDGEAGEPTVVGSATVHAPGGAAVDRLGALLFVARPDAASPTVSIFKLLPDGRLVTFASGLPAAQGLAIEPEGHLLVVVPGVVPTLLRFLAAGVGDLAVPSATHATTTAITGTAQPGSVVAVYRAADAGELLAVAEVDTAGRFTAAVPLETNTANSILLTPVGAGGDGLAGRPAALSILHDDRPPVVSLGATSAEPLHGSVELTADARDAGAGLRALTLYVDARIAGFVDGPEGADTLAVSARLDTLALDDGAHMILVVAEDHAGNTTSEVRTVLVDNTPEPDPIAVASGQIQTIRSAVAALLRAGQCSWGTSCLGWASDGFHGIDVLIEYGHLAREYDGNINPWGGPYGVVGGIDAYAVKIHGLPPGPPGDALCRDLAAALAGQARSTSCWGGWDQKLFEAGFPNL